jgi:outer membrane receptor protein involved in Fe transport
LSVGLRWQHLPQLDRSPNDSLQTLPVHSHDQFDVYGSWQFGQRWTLRGGIDNLLNADPEWVGATEAVTVNGVTGDPNHAIGAAGLNYDQIGRRIFFGVTMTL